MAIVTMPITQNTTLGAKNSEEGINMLHLVFHYVKLLFWLVLFTAMIVFAYLYSKDRQEQCTKNWRMLDKLTQENDRLQQVNSHLRKKNSELDVIIMQKTAEATTLSHTIEELRKRLNAT